jgi:hypothetical protein
MAVGGAMMSKFSIPHPIFLAALGLLFAGCGTPGEHPAAPPPRMPKVGTAPPPPAAHLSEAEVTRAAIEWVRKNEIPSALRAIDGAGDTLPRARMRVAVTTAVAADNPAAAGAFAVALSPGPTHTACVEIAARAWWQRDPAAALHWAMGLADPAAAATARRTVATEWVRDDPRDLVNRLMELPQDSARDDTLAITAAAWARVSADDAVAWLNELPAGALRERIVSSVAFEIAQSNPHRALSLAESLPAARNRWLLLTAIAQTWVAVDVGAAMAWAGGLPAGASRDAAMAGVDTGFGVPGSRRGANAREAGPPRSPIGRNSVHRSSPPGWRGNRPACRATRRCRNISGSAAPVPPATWASG